ncbi:TraB/GumN family protein [Marilutibacter chinensis]|uniref:TraB/GumN family protein n=1 Tax=Marilutibacter chinensis TaxID=2912247 RepID=A0ABS9HRD5_9GAMM|nr:TraB/GumN family protein [Lysobacter chinensis]MCF7220905.1 TraB/GumN family protein [Lysobacter chinensis]
MRIRPLSQSLAATVLAIGLSFAASAAESAGTATEPPVQPDASASAPVPLLWQVSDDDNTVYLLGAFHLLKAADYPLSADVDAAFEDAERLVFEVSPEQIDDPSNTAKFLQAAGYADGGKLSDVLPSPTYDRLATVMGGAGLPMAAFDRFEPWFVSLSLLMGMAQPLGFSGEQGLDRHLMVRAREAGKPASGLETLEHQLGVLDGAPMDEQVIGLTELVEAPEEAARKLDELHAAWRGGDIEALERLAIDEMKEKTPETYRTVNVERNQAWLPQLRGMLDEAGEDDVMVVVGAMHLAGDDGLIEGLREAGYRVERICSACAAD